MSLYGYINYSFPPGYLYKIATLIIIVGICFVFFEMIKEMFQKEQKGRYFKTTETMIAGVAHELNNPLTIVAGNLELIRMRLNKLEIGDELLMKYLDRQVSGVERVSNFIEEIKQLSKQSGSVTDHIYINRLIEDVVEGSTASSNNIYVKINLPITVDIKIPFSNDIKNIFSELLNNGIDAVIENKGKKRIIIESYIENEFVVVVIQDNGKGMSKDEISKAFNYFYTTKPPSKKAGQGLGLSVVENVVNSLGGGIQMASKEGEWTRVLVKLPMVNR
jgi:two-component system sporulation sensor kinase B